MDRAFEDLDDARRRMVADQIRARGVRDTRVLDALERVPRHRFLSDDLRADAYKDHPVAIGFGQTISQPYIVGYMTEALRIELADRVLEIGTGCGYQTALLAEFAQEVYSVELIDALATRARHTLDDLGYTNVTICTGDGYAGWPEHAPYDRILVAAAPEEVPRPLIDQLADGGILVIPVGGWDQHLRVLRKHGHEMVVLSTLPVRFVPLVRESNQ